MMNGRYSRRGFLKQATGTLALGALGPAAVQRFWAAPASFLLPPDEELLRRLAATAIEAATAAGATFADVRVAAGRDVGVTCSYFRSRDKEAGMRNPGVVLNTEYGVRVIVDDVWGIATGHELTPDGVAAVARAAVRRASANSRRTAATLELAPAAGDSEGRWSTPIRQDPFDIPLGEQADRQLAAINQLVPMIGVVSAAVSFGWQQTDRVFASSEGALQVQRLVRASTGATVDAAVAGPASYVSEPVVGLKNGGYGFEAVDEVDLQEQFRLAAERALLRSMQMEASIPAEVGRADVVLDAAAVATLLVDTFGAALNAERALGYYANGEGTSFASPPATALGTMRVGSSLLTLHGDRSRAHGAMTVGWDDEGVKPVDFTMVKDGILTAYQTNRQTGAEIGAGRRSPGGGVVANGCASGAGRMNPTVQVPNLRMESAADPVSCEDLIAGVSRGFFVERVAGGMDQQVLNGQFAGAGEVREIRNGKLGKRVNHLALQFITPSFWQSLDGVGGHASAEEHLRGTGHLRESGGIQLQHTSVSAPPAMFRGVNVLSTGGAT